MHRIHVSVIALVAAAAVACSGGMADSPVAPTPAPIATTPAPAPPPSLSTSCLPAAPTNLQVTVDETRRTFTWNASANAVDYYIMIGTESGSSDLLFTNTSHTTFAWNGSSRGSYFARVHAHNACGSSANSNEVRFN